MADTNRDDITVVDFGDCGLDVSTADLDYTSKELQDLAYKIVDACSTVGFVYLRNHGIQKTEINEPRSKVDEFLGLPIDIKEKYARIRNHGWVRMEQERRKYQRPGDLKESYNATPAQADPNNWPEDLVPGFKTDIMTLFNRCDSLAHRLLKIIALGLGIKNLNVFSSMHNTAEKGNWSSLRFLYYPPVTMEDVKTGQNRLGEHTDFSTITLLFLDKVGGLEARGRDGKWIAVPHIPGTLLVMTGDVLQRWTADALYSVMHRISVADGNADMSKARRSIAYFVHPDVDCLVKCIDGSDKYPPITFKDYLKELFNDKQ